MFVYMYVCMFVCSVCVVCVCVCSVCVVCVCVCLCVCVNTHVIIMMIIDLPGCSEVRYSLGFWVG